MLDGNTEDRMTERSAYLVLQVPFFRWAVAINERPDLPAMAFYRKVSAMAFRDECAANFPDRSVVLLRRSLRGLEIEK